MTLERIYLDNAATSWPKPEAAYAAVDRYLRQNGAPAGRSAYAEAAAAERLVHDARAAIARLLGVQAPERVVFAFNGTDALNLAIHGLLKPGDHVVTTVVEHNSVLRPLAELEQHGSVRVTRVGCNSFGQVSADDVRAALQPETRLVAIVHASNVTGAIQPVEEIAEIAHRHSAYVLIDAAQTAGHLPIKFSELGCDLLAAPGHKGLLGPLGTGILALAPGMEERLASVRQGGTGTRSEVDRQPAALPDKYEAGNHNVPGIAGLGAAVEFLLERGVAALHSQTVEHCGRLLERLSGIEGLTLYGPRSAAERVGVVSLSLAGYDSQEVAATLDSVYRIQVRSGIHCAPLMHRALGTLDQGGTVRLSLGPFTTAAHVDAAADAIAEIAAAAVRST
jgi:cysteine desulfurase family protein